jgi:hypothetical protein
LANLWLCWFDENFTPYCHPVADKQIPGAHLSLLVPGDLGRRITLGCQGLYGAFMNITATSDRTHSRFTIPIVNSVIWSTRDTTEFKFTSSAVYVCSHRFDTESMPTHRPPVPPESLQTYFLTGVINGHGAGLNPRHMEHVVAEVILGFNVHYH